MPVLSNTQAHTESLLRKMLDLIEELSVHYGQMRDDEPSLPAQERELMALLAEDAGERGLDEAQVEKILRLTLQMAREGAEG